MDRKEALAELNSTFEAFVDDVDYMMAEYDRTLEEAALEAITEYNTWSAGMYRLLILDMFEGINFDSLPSLSYADFKLHFEDYMTDIAPKKLIALWKKTHGEESDDD